MRQHQNTTVAIDKYAKTSAMLVCREIYIVFVKKDAFSSLFLSVINRFIG
jgi:hypothetical protein